MRPTVNTEKHYTQFSLFAVASGAVENQILFTAVETPAAAAQVRTGAKVSAVYIEMWLTSDDTAAGTAIVTLEKAPGIQTVLMSAASSAALDGYNNKKNIFHTQMGLVGPNTQYPMASVKGWFKIPKSKQRFGVNDRLILNIHGQSNGLAGCGFVTFKEQF